MALNEVIYQGRLTKDVHYDKTPKDISVVSFNLAVPKDFKNADGTRDADFFRVIAYREVADNFATYLKKGSHIIVYGRNTTRDYVDENGEKRMIVELVARGFSFCESRRSPQNLPANEMSAPPAALLPDSSFPLEASEFEEAFSQADSPF